MSKQFEDPCIKVFVIQIPDQNLLPSTVLPIIEVPGSYKPVFFRDLTAPLGSFLNPILHNPSSKSGIPDQVPATPVMASPSGPPPHVWQRDPSAPLGSFLNPHPHKASNPTAAEAPTSKPASKPAQKSASRKQHQRRLNLQDLDSRPPWLPTAADVDRLFPSGPAGWHPSAANQASPIRRSSLRQQRNESLDGRHVHFEHSRLPAQTIHNDTAPLASMGSQDIDGIYEYIDPNAADTHGSPRRRVPTPMPGAYSSYPPPPVSGRQARSGQTRTGSQDPQPLPRPPKIPIPAQNTTSTSRPPSNLQTAVNSRSSQRRNSPHRRTASSGSTINPRTGPGVSDPSSGPDPTPAQNTRFGPTQLGSRDPEGPRRHSSPRRQYSRCSSTSSSNSFTTAFSSTPSPPSRNREYRHTRYLRPQSS
ncbi:MAG: hypothetical protein Q9201_005171 [Fulgogasparrea decipioides]